VASGGIAVLSIILSCSPAAAEPDWFFGPRTVTLGAEARFLPSFEGSSNTRFLPFPVFDIRRAGEARRFKSPRDGASIGIIETNNFRLGPTLKIRLPRNEGDDIALRGLGDTKFAIEAGGFVEFWPVEWLRTRAELRQGFNGHHGLVADINADVVYKVSPQLTWSGGPRTTFESASTMQTYYGIDAQQSLLSGLPAYNPSRGLRSVGAGTLVRYEITPRWATHVFLEYERLTGPAANSPLITMRGSRNQVTTGIGLSYAFDIGGFSK
jgi:outer membrane protein